MYAVALINFIICKALSTAIFASVPKVNYITERYIIKLISGRKIQNYKRNTLLFFKVRHKIHLVFMYILQRKYINCRLFRIKTYRYSLNNTYIINRTFHIKIGKRYMSCVFVYFNRFYRCRNFLYQCQIALLIFFICEIDKIF
jgi:hypothetical protein